MTRRARGILVGSGITVLFVSYLGVIVLNQMKQPGLSGTVAKDVAEAIELPEQRASPETGVSQRVEVSWIRDEPSEEELLWLARCIYSETKRPIEQLLVAWVVRNRVETQYGGNDSYKEVILDPYQFSAFNPESDLTLPDLASDSTGWKETVRLARYVMKAPASDRPFSVITRHFYSERSMPDHRKPSWVGKSRALQINGHDIDEERFRFYSGIL